jgi:hypothetical protein
LAARFGQHVENPENQQQENIFPCADKAWHVGCIRRGCGVEIVTSFALTSTAIPRVSALTEDPPFGGLWCDQPAIFFLVENACGVFNVCA